MKRFLILILLCPILLRAQHFGNTVIELKSLPTTPATDLQVLRFLEAYDIKFLSSSEQEWFYWTNYSRINPRRFWDSVVAPIVKVYPQFQNDYAASLQKDLYTRAALPLIKPSRLLRNVAKDHAEALAQKKASPSHTSPNGNTFQMRMQDANIQKCAGENISFGPPNTVLALVLLYLDQGVHELGHRMSLLNPKYTEMGIGVAPFPNNNVMVIQDFSCNQGL